MCIRDRLKGLGTAVTVAARDDRQLAHADCLGYDTVLLEDLASDIDRFDFIFNTIPAMVLDSVLLEAAKPEAAIVDIASAPGGVDFETCRRLGIPAKLCPGLPGVYAPMSSAEILYEAVMDLSLIHICSDVIAAERHLHHLGIALQRHVQCADRIAAAGQISNIRVEFLDRYRRLHPDCL